jgi:Fe-S-cluster containining protein
MLGAMELPARDPRIIKSSDSQLVQIRDSQLVQIVDNALSDAAARAGAWLACKPGCTQCCYGSFAINALDVARLQSTLHAVDPEIAGAVRARARSWIAEYSSEFPGDPATGILGTSDEEQARFDDFANDAPCPALNPDTGLCDVYVGRPMTCRVFGPPTRPAGGDALGCCELCFNGATEEQIAACEMPVPHQFEEQLVAQIGDTRETVVAFALLPTSS